MRKPEWKNAPRGSEYLAQSYYGSWIWFSGKPKANLENNTWNIEDLGPRGIAIVDQGSHFISSDELINKKFHETLEQRHGALDMTTNQTIDGVPRELLRWMDDFINDGLELSKEEASISAQLRALLDAPTVESELSRMTRRCQNAELALKVQTENYEALKAAQPHGEPVAVPDSSMSDSVRNERRYLVLRDGNAVAPEEHCIHGGRELDALCDGIAAGIKGFGELGEYIRQSISVAPEPHGDAYSGYVETNQNMNPLYLNTLILPEQSEREKPKHLNRHGKVPPAGNDRITMRNVHLVGSGSSPAPITYTLNGVIVNLDGYTCYAPGAGDKVVKDYQNKINHLKQLLRNVRATLHFSPEDVLAIDAALREDK